jgi:outer membrane protein TolC
MEVYKILSVKHRQTLGQPLDGDTTFTVEQTPYDPLEGLPRKVQPLIKETAAPGAPEGARSGEAAPLPAAAKEPSAIISLPKAVEIAFRNSRDYQSAKETMYLSALALTLERFRWSPQFTELLTGQVNRANRDESWTGSSSFGVSQLLATGGTLTASLASELVSFTTGAPRTSGTSVLAANLIQPLWRGAGARIAQESLTQAERNVIYAIRTFARFHRTFAVSVATSYYQLLEQRSIVKNQWASYQISITSRVKTEKLAQAGRVPEFQVDQTRQQELSDQDAYISATETYGDTLDQFKLTLGLRTDANVDVDEDELTKLVAAGIIHPRLSMEQALKQALALRLDLMNQRDETADAARQVDVAADGLGPDVSLVASASVPTPANQNRPYIMRFEQGTYNAGLDVNLPLTRKAERNTYRQALISLEQARRAESLLQDNIRLQVRREWNTLQERKQSYEIQVMSVRLAERRVASTSLLLEAGRVTANDLLLAQSSLLSARNALITALVDHTVARLQLWRDVETLLVTSEGSLEESIHVGTPATEAPVQ